MLRVILFNHRILQNVQIVYGSRSLYSRVLDSALIDNVHLFSEQDTSVFSIKELKHVDSAMQDKISQEIAIRLSKIIKNLPQLFPDFVRKERSFQFVEDYFHLNFKEITSSRFCTVVKNKESIGVLNHIETRLGGTTEMVSDAILSSKILGDKKELAGLEASIRTLFRSNLSVEVLVGVLSGKISGKACLVDGVSVQENISSAYDNARYLCEQHYISSPELIVSGDQPAVTYFPAHLYLIFFELLKNSLRATIEHHGEECESPPPVLVNTSSADDFIKISISDSGGGFKTGDIGQLFNFFNTSASINNMSLYQGAHSSPLAGYGFGLGMVKLYIEYFGGHIGLLNTDSGMQVELLLKARPELARETI